MSVESNKQKQLDLITQNLGKSVVLHYGSGQWSYRLREGESLQQWMVGEEDFYLSEVKIVWFDHDGDLNIQLTQ